MKLAREVVVDLPHTHANTEDRIAAARRFYNNNVREYNIAIETYPGNALKGERTPKPFFMKDF